MGNKNEQLFKGPSASTVEHCICIVSDLLWLGLVWSCFVFCLLFVLLYVICAPVLTEGTYLSICMVWGGRHLKLRDICMDLEPCFKVHNLVVIQLKNTKLDQMTNFNVVFYMVVSIYKLDQIYNYPLSPARF